MFGASGKLPGGFYSSGNSAAPGLFEECLSSQGLGQNFSFKGQYCTVYFSVEDVTEDELEQSSNKSSRNWLAIHQWEQLLFNGPKLKNPKERNGDLNTAFGFLPSVGICIPSSCSALDFRSAVAQLVGHSSIANSTKEDSDQLIYKSVVTTTDEDYCFTQVKIDSSPSFDGPDIAVM